jgi:exosome complex RNA-binding protein Rrp42 (RNase PH superfamily)
MVDFFPILPTLVNVIRVPKGPSDLMGEMEKVTGFLVDEAGNDIEYPQVGMPICLGSAKREDKPVFKSVAEVMFVDPSLEEENGQGTGFGWIVTTTDGHLYMIESEKIMH